MSDQNVKGNLFENIGKLSERMEAAVDLYVETAARELEGEMKKDAPWTDRTGAARGRLTSTVHKENRYVYVIRLSHGVWYGVYLELAHEKKYAVIQPTIVKKQYEVLSGFKNLLNRMK